MSEEVAKSEVCCPCREIEEKLRQLEVAVQELEEISLNKECLREDIFKKIESMQQDLIQCFIDANCRMDAMKDSASVGKLKLEILTFYGGICEGVESRVVSIENLFELLEVTKDSVKISITVQGAIYNRFWNSEIAYESQAELYELVQGDMDVESYITKFEELCLNGNSVSLDSRMNPFQEEKDDENHMASHQSQHQMKEQKVFLSVGGPRLFPFKNRRKFAVRSWPSLKEFSPTPSSGNIEPSPPPSIQSKPSVYKGEPVFPLTKEEDETLAAPFKLSLVGKFSKRRPKMDFLWHQFQKIGFKGSYSLGMIDHRHIHILFDLEEDYHLCWIKGLWSFDHHIMRVLKWTPQFNTEHESSIVPVWIAFEGLPLHRFNAEYLSKLASIVGTPLKIDVPTLNLSRPSIARVCIEVNLLHELPQRVLVGTEEYSYYQDITDKNLPEYCSECKKVGHGIKDCRRGKPKVQPIPAPKAPMKVPEKMKAQHLVPQTNWKPKTQANDKRDTQVKSSSDASSSGLSTKEKGETLIDISEKSPFIPSSGKWRISKEQLETILENSKEGDKVDAWDDQEQQHKIDPTNNICKQLAVYIPQVDLSSRIDVLDDLKEDNGEAEGHMGRFNSEDNMDDERAKETVTSVVESDSDLDEVAEEI
ncbi:OLC1v1012999C1 [Oldenlandia corymbosa var. corymbosa]|uniref:OLC1v1012999C1 n=1 Tax=Oldenlandia corymbosa var. corymbosa TaxID=529605 RepID=A0AAV1DX78_OLDCO|nr:OLC1v1012999C1 [Oldenlandia corymbosa var. corymbosa]